MVTPGVMSVCTAVEFDTAKSTIQFRLSGVAARNQKDRGQERDEKVIKSHRGLLSAIETMISAGRIQL